MEARSVEIRLPARLWAKRMDELAGRRRWPRPSGDSDNGLFVFLACGVVSEIEPPVPGRRSDPSSGQPRTIRIDLGRDHAPITRKFADAQHPDRPHHDCHRHRPPRPSDPSPLRPRRPVLAPLPDLWAARAGRAVRHALRARRRYGPACHRSTSRRRLNSGRSAPRQRPAR